MVTPKLPRLPKIPNPVELVGDAASVAIEIATIPAEVIRGAKMSGRSAKDQLIRSLKGGGSPPDPLRLVSEVANAALNPIRSAVSEATLFLGKYLPRL